MPLFKNPLSVNNQVAPLLKAQEDHLMSQIPDSLKEAMPDESPSKLFQDFTTTGNTFFKQKAHQALGALATFTENAKQAASKFGHDSNDKLAEIFPTSGKIRTLEGQKEVMNIAAGTLGGASKVEPILQGIAASAIGAGIGHAIDTVPAMFGLGTTEYNRKDVIYKDIPKSIPEDVAEGMFQGKSEHVTPAIFTRLLNAENKRFDRHATVKNEDGSTDYGLFQINSSNLPWIRQMFRNEGKTFDPYNTVDSAKAASFLLEDNYSKFNKSVGRPPTDDELIGSFNQGLSDTIKAAKDDIRQKKQQDSYVARTLSDS